MKKPETIMGCIRNLIFGKLLLSKSRVNMKAFTRNRKVGFVTLPCPLTMRVNIDIIKIEKKCGENMLYDIKYPTSKLLCAKSIIVFIGGSLCRDKLKIA